jgi:prolipoprotein diacylglyceryltransferase
VEGVKKGDLGNASSAPQKIRLHAPTRNYAGLVHALLNYVMSRHEKHPKGWIGVHFLGCTLLARLFSESKRDGRPEVQLISWFTTHAVNLISDSLWANSSQ